MVPCNCSGGIKLTKMTSNKGSWSVTTASDSSLQAEQMKGKSSTNSSIRRGVLKAKVRPMVQRRMNSMPRADSQDENKCSTPDCTVADSCTNYNKDIPLSSSIAKNRKTGVAQLLQSVQKDDTPYAYANNSHSCLHSHSMHCPSFPKIHSQDRHLVLSKDLPASPLDSAGTPFRPTTDTAPDVKSIKSRKPARSSSQQRLHAIIPTPALENALEREAEYKIVSQTVREDELVAEKMDEEHHNDEDQMQPFFLGPLELVGLDNDDTNSDSQSVIDLDSIVIDEDSFTDAGPEPSIIDEELTCHHSKQEVNLRRQPRLPRCPSMPNIHRRVRVYDEQLFSVDYEHGLSDLGPEPEILIDEETVTENIILQDTVAESTSEQVTDASSRDRDQWPQRSLHVKSLRKSNSAAIIESLFAPKKAHSCCKNRRKSSWNGGSSRKHSMQTKQVRYRRPRKVVVVGDMCTGKSGLISAYCKDRFSDMYIPTILRSCLTDADICGEKIELVVIEVSGRDDYAKLRRCAYRRTDAIILCYSSDNVASLDKIKSHWLPEIQTFSSNVPYILVGTKKDIREEMLDQLEQMMDEERTKRLHGTGNNIKSLKGRLVSTEDGYEMAESIGAYSFHECSARYRDGTRVIFETVAKVALKKSRRKRKVQRTGDICSIM